MHPEPPLVRASSYTPGRVGRAADAGFWTLPPPGIRSTCHWAPSQNLRRARGGL